MSFGFPAYSTGARRFNLGQRALIEVIGESLSRLGWNFEPPMFNTFIARNRVNMWSWGEKIAVEVSHDGVVTARSECLAPTQCIDWGKNRRNVGEFFDEVSRVVIEHESRGLPVAPYNEAGLTPMERIIIETEKEEA